MLKPKVTLRGQMIEEFGYLYRNHYEPFTCLILHKCLRQLGYNLNDTYILRERYNAYLKIKYNSNFGGIVFKHNIPPKERLQNLLDFIKSEGL